MREKYRTVPRVRTPAPRHAGLLGVDLVNHEGYFKTVAEVEREAVLKVVKAVGEEAAASALGIGRTTLYRKLKLWRTL